MPQDRRRAARLPAEPAANVEAPLLADGGLAAGDDGGTQLSRTTTTSPETMILRALNA
jgi:hypothetical protein